MNKPLLRSGWLSSLLLAALIPLCVASLSAKAQTDRWYVEVLIDPISKAPILEARILSRMGYRFHITKRDDNSLWADFRVPRQIKKTINLKRLPTYWIDGADPVNLESLKELEVGFKPSLYEISEKRVQFILWAALKQGQVPPPLRNFMLGETLHIQYWTPAGEMEHAKIPLKRANEAIAQMLNVAPLPRRIRASPKRRGATFEAVARRYLDFCEELRFVGSDTDYGTCRSRFVNCSESPDQSEKSFEECLNKVE